MSCGLQRISINMWLLERGGPLVAYAKLFPTTQRPMWRGTLRAATFLTRSSTVVPVAALLRILKLHLTSTCPSVLWINRKWRKFVYRQTNIPLGGWQSFAQEDWAVLRIWSSISSETQWAPTSAATAMTSPIDPQQMLETTARPSTSQTLSSILARSVIWHLEPTLAFTTTWPEVTRRTSNKICNLFPKRSTLPQSMWFLFRCSVVSGGA